MANAKNIIIENIITSVEKQIKTAEQGRKDAMEEFKFHKGVMDSRYDTFKQEAEFLTGAYDKRLVELQKMLQTLRTLKADPPNIVRCSMYSIIEIKDLDDDSVFKYFLLPVGGGGAYEINGEKIVILSAGTSLAQALIGSIPGDEIEAKFQGILKQFKVVSLS